MKLDTRDLVSITEAGRSLSKLADHVQEGRSFVVLRNNQAAMAIVPMAVMDQIARLDEREADLRLIALAMVREATDSGRRHSLDDVLAEFDAEPVEGA